jgi:hypothetical protein
LVYHFCQLIEIHVAKSLELERALKLGRGPIKVGARRPEPSVPATFLALSSIRARLRRGAKPRETAEIGLRHRLSAAKLGRSEEVLGVQLRAIAE